MQESWKLDPDGGESCLGVRGGNLYIVKARTGKVPPKCLRKRGENGSVPPLNKAEIEILRESVQAMKQAQACPAHEGYVAEAFGPMDSSQDFPLEKLSHAIDCMRACGNGLPEILFPHAGMV
jgi:hypothetical protein